MGGTTNGAGKSGTFRKAQLASSMCPFLQPLSVLTDGLSTDGPCSRQCPNSRTRPVGSIEATFVTDPVQEIPFFTKIQYFMIYPLFFALFPSTKCDFRTNPSLFKPPMTHVRLPSLAQPSWGRKEPYGSLSVLFLFLPPREGPSTLPSPSLSCSVSFPM